MAFHCHWERQLGALGGRVWDGVQTREVESVMRTRRIPIAERWELLQKIRRFISVACSGLNDIERERADEARGK